MCRMVTPWVPAVTKLEKLRLSCTLRKQICLQQLAKKPSAMGNRLAKSYALMVSLTWVPALLWNDRMNRCWKLCQLQQKWQVQLPSMPLTMMLRLSWAPRTSSMAWRSIPGAASTVFFDLKHVSTFGGLHGGINNWVELGYLLSMW